MVGMVIMVIIIVVVMVFRTDRITRTHGTNKTDRITRTHGKSNFLQYYIQVVGQQSSALPLFHPHHCILDTWTYLHPATINMKAS